MKHLYITQPVLSCLTLLPDAIAKIALQIQAEEAPKYYKVFVGLGTFHTDMSFLEAIGKYITESGGPYILNECHILEKGSLKSFINGKGYKRCKGIRELIAAAMEILHFKLFLQQHDAEMQEILCSELDTIVQSKKLDTYELSPDVNTIVEEYINITESRKTGSKVKQLSTGWVIYKCFIYTMNLLEVFVLEILIFTSTVCLE